MEHQVAWLVNPAAIALAEKGAREQRTGDSEEVSLAAEGSRSDLLR